MESAASPAIVSPAIVARGLVKRYGKLTAVDGVDLAAPAGTCLGLLGPNGAGKTTTIEVLEGLKEPDAGEVKILGLDWQRSAREIRERIGVQLQETKLQEKLTVTETLRLFRSFYGKSRDLDEILATIGLEEKRHARIDSLSGGQKQRLSLGCALVNRPEILFLDEPTTGLDPQARRRVWEIVDAFKQEGGTVLLTTHYMEEAEQLADELVIIDRGKIIVAGTPRALVASLEAESIVTLRPRNGGVHLEVAAASLEALPGVKTARQSDNGVITLSVTDTQASLGALLELLARHDVALEDLHTHRPTLEDVFVAHTGKHLRDE